MKYYSEVLNKTFDTEKECLKAEQEAAAAKKKAELEEKAKKEARAARAAEVEQALKDARTADMKADELLRAFVKDYGSYHTTLKDADAYIPFNSIFDLFF